MKSLLRRLFLMLALLALAGGGVLYWQYSKTMHAPLRGDSQIAVVKKGESIVDIAQNLKRSYGLIADWPLILRARITGEARRIKAGAYRIQPGMTVSDVLLMMVEGKVAVFQFRLIEGKTTAQLLAQLKETPTLRHTDKTLEEIAQALDIDDGQLEGWFLPDTYQYHYQTSDITLLQRLHTGMKTFLTEAWQQRASGLPLNSPYQALILASIVEKETAVASERAKVAGVFIRRLQKGMRLQADSSVLYGLQNEKATLTKKDLQTDAPYNTYTRQGLPPTPIAMPSRESIWAALHPDTSENLYFVADGKGGHIFSKTYNEHQKAVEHYRKIRE